MPFWVYGRDASSGQPRDPLFIETEHEDDARNQAAEAGVEIFRVHDVAETGQALRMTEAILGKRSL